MKPKYSFSSGYYVGFLLLQVMTSTSEKWTVITPMEHVVATVGGQAELSCQLSPPQSAKHMEVSWFKGNHSKLVHLYRDDHEMNGSTAPEYVDRIEFVKEAIGDGKVTLRLHNVSISDNGPYQCSFKGSDFRDVASMDLSVAALGSETQIFIDTPSSGGLMVECNSGGWFPQPQMEWRDNKGKVVPHSSKSYSRDGAGLFYMKMILLLRDRSQNNVICYIHNPLSREEKQINILLADALFHPVYTFLIVLISFLCGILIVIFVFLFCRCFKKKVFPCDFNLLNTGVAVFLTFGCCAVLVLYILFRTRVSLPDPLFSFYNAWMKSIAGMIVALMVFYIALIIGLYLTVRGLIRLVLENTQERCKEQNVGMENTAQEMIDPDQHDSVD